MHLLKHYTHFSCGSTIHSLGRPAFNIMIFYILRVFDCTAIKINRHNYNATFLSTDNFTLCFMKIVLRAFFINFN